MTTAGSGYPEIRFGTDGWRAVLGVEFTTDRFAAAIDGLIGTAAFAAAKRSGTPIVVAHDTRFLADAFARLAAQRLYTAGFRVVLSDGPAATPGIGAAIVARGAAAGLMITASHNPPEYLGLKLKGPYGGSATTDWLDEAMAVMQGLQRGNPAAPPALPDALDPAIERADIHAEHLARIRTFMPLTPGNDVLVHDAMYGSGSGLLARALADSGARVVGVRQSRNPGFDGIGPEPVPERLTPMREAVLAHGAALGVATDGDGDRIAACDAAGRFVYPHEVFALMLVHLVDRMGKRGKVVRNLATSELVRKVAADRGLDVVTTAVGFKHIVAEMLAGGVLIGGEESGGIAVTEHLPERDGILCGLMLREIVLQGGKPLRQQLDDLYATYGPSTYKRWDLHIPRERKNAILARLHEAPPETLGRSRVRNIDRSDGYKFQMAEDTWMLVRASGTEPILRVYIEATAPDRVQQIYDDFVSWAQG